MSLVEAHHYEMLWWERMDLERQTYCFGKVSEIRLVRLESQENDDIV